MYIWVQVGLVGWEMGPASEKMPRDTLSSSHAFAKEVIT